MLIDRGSPSNPNGPKGGESRVEMLLHAYAEARDDDRYYFTQWTTLVTLALSVIVVMAGIYSQTCTRGSLECQITNLFPIPVWVYIGGPILPTALLSFCLVLSTSNTLRSYYLRAIEYRLHELTDQSNDSFPVPSWSHITLEVTGQSTAAPLPRANWYIMYAIALAIVGTWGYVIFFKIPETRHRIFAFVVNGLLLVVPALLARIDVTRGESLWHDSLEHLPKRLTRTANNFPDKRHTRTDRTLTSFLILPRNQEELIKSLFVPGCFLIGVILSPQPDITAQRWSSQLLHASVFYFAFEFLIYQARYLWNDVRDRFVDAGDAFGKARFPKSRVKDPSALRAAAACFVVRWIIALLLVVCILPVRNYLWVWHLSLLSGVFAVGALYELVRTRCNCALTDVSRRRWTWLLVGVVGLGYGLRSYVGLWLGGMSEVRPLILGTAGACLFGSAFVSLTWALEATRPGVGGNDTRKAHLATFRELVTAMLPKSLRMGTATRVLSGRQAALSPWSLSAILATAVLVQFTLSTAGTSARNQLWLPCALGYCAEVNVLAVSAMAAVVIAALALVVSVTIARVLALVQLIAFVSAFLWFGVSPLQTAVAAAIAALPVTVTCAFRGMRFDDLSDLWGPVRQQVLNGVTRLYLWFIRER